VKDITCKARNKAGLFGQQCVAVPLEGDESVVYSTRAASRHQQIKLQLKNALQITENEPNQKHIDTIFLQVRKDGNDFFEYIGINSLDLLGISATHWYR
jgi:hypothetical protein